MFAFVLLVLHFRKFNFARTLKLNKRIKLYKSEILAVILSCLLGLFSLPRVDDGWYLLMARMYEATGFFDNYAFAAARPTGQLYTALLSQLLTQAPLIFTLRLVAILSIVLIWIFIRRTWLKFEKNSTIVLAWSIWALVSSGSLMTLRPEPLVTLATTIAVSAIHLNRCSLLTRISIMYFASVMALAIHQSGLIPLFGTIALTIYLFVSKKIQVKDISTNHFFIFSLSIASLFAYSNPLWVLRASQDFEVAANRSISNNNVPFYMEWKRFQHLFFEGNSTALQILFGILIILSYAALIALTYKLIRHKPEVRDVYFLVFSLVAPFGLFLSPIKWSWYFPILIPMVIINFVLVNRYYSILFSRNNITIVNLLFLITSFMILYLIPWRSNEFLLDFQDSRYIAFALSNYESILFVFFLILIFLFIKKLLLNNTKILMSFTIFFFVLFQLIPPILASTETSNWSFIKQSVNGVFAKDVRCGILNAANNNTLIDRHPTLKDTNREIILMPELYIFVPCENPVELSNGIYGSPDFGFGWVPYYDQQRVAFAFLVDQKVCFSGLSGSPTSCFFKWEQVIPDIGEPRIEILTTW